MITREIEALIKNTLSQYAQDYNTINHEDEEGNPTGEKKIDFNITFSNHVMDPNQIEGYDPNDPKFATVKAYQGKTLSYMRIVKVLFDDEGTQEKRVIYTGYRPVDDFKDKESLKRSLMMEALKSLMIGGLEYSEAIHRINQEKLEKDGVELES
jgi:hypothetical protein